MDMESEKRLLSIKDTADYLGISVHTLYTWVSQKRVPYVKIGRLTKFDVKIINEWIKNLSVEPKKCNT